MTDELPHLPVPRSGDALVQVEVLPPELVPKTGRGVTLHGEAAHDITDSLGALARTGAGLTRRATASTYRLVPSEKAAKGLADGTLRWATAKHGDASVLIKNKATGRIASQGTLQKARPHPAKVLGPVAWEAMAMATQQHYLVEINDKLESVQRGIDEVLSRMDDDKLGTLRQARRTAGESAAALAEGRTLSPNRLRDVRDAAQRTDVAFHQLQERMTRVLGDYRRGETSARDVEQSWALLLMATQALCECSAVLTAVPYATVHDLEDATAEERERALSAIEEVRHLAGELHDGHQQWGARKDDWDLRARNPVKAAVRKVRRRAPVEPKQQPLDYATAWRASQLAIPPRPPDSLLVTVSPEGNVTVAAEQPSETTGLADPALT